MGKAIPTQHPAVVLRASYVHLRRLLAIAMIAVVGLTAAVVILANDEGGQSSSSAGTQSAINRMEQRWAAYDKALRALTPAQLTAAFSATAAADGTRYDGGPEEGTRGIASQPPASRYDGGPDEGTRGPGH